MSALIQRIRLKKAKIGIIGMGYVGLPLALRFSEEGFNVIGFDIDKTKLRKLAKGQTYIKQYTNTRIRQMVDKGFIATANFKKVSTCDALIMCLPTPLGDHQEPDLSYIHDTMNMLLPHLKKKQLLSLESTTYPGTTDEEIMPLLKQRGLIPGKNFYLAYSPEREDPGNADFHTRIIPKVVSGITKECQKVAEELYGAIVEKVIPVSSTRVAEMTKILENTQRLVNIALMNEMKQLCDKMEIDPFEVIQAAATKPFGFMPYYPGPGVGGHCIPVDPLYLTWKAKEYGLSTRFIELASEVNALMPHWVVQKTSETLNRSGKPIKNSRLLLLGIAYKSNVDDMRESPAAEIIMLLQQAGAKVSYADPWIPRFPKMRGYQIDLRSIKLTAATLQRADAIIICTGHDAFDYDLIAKHAKIIIDTRGKYALDSSKIVRG